MADLSDLLMETLPNILGLLLIGYALFLIYRSKVDFFQAARSWILILFMATLSVLWAYEILKEAVGGWIDQAHPKVDLVFIVVAVWLSTAMVMLSTVYGRFNSLDHFKKWLRTEPLNAITAWGIVGLALILLILLAPIDSETDLEGNTWALVLVLAYLLASIALDAVIGIWASSKRILPRLTTESKRDMQFLAVAWMGIPLVEFLADVILDMRLGYHEWNPYGWLMVLLFVAIVRSISSTKFTGLIIDPEIEDVKRSGFRVYDIPRGVYLVEDQKSAAAFGLFSELVTLPLSPDAEVPGKSDSASATIEFLIPQGLVVSREFPDSIRKTYNLQVTPILWLTETPGEMRIAPTSLAVLTDTLIRFMEKNPNSIVLVEGLEYVGTFNEFRKVARSLDSLNETAWITKGRLLICLDPKAFDEKDLALLERDRRVVKGAAGIEELKRESHVEVMAKA